MSTPTTDNDILDHTDYLPITTIEDATPTTAMHTSSGIASSTDLNIPTQPISTDHEDTMSTTNNVPTEMIQTDSTNTGETTEDELLQTTSVSSTTSDIVTDVIHTDFTDTRETTEDELLQTTAIFSTTSDMVIDVTHTDSTDTEETTEDELLQTTAMDEVQTTTAGGSDVTAQPEVSATENSNDFTAGLEMGTGTEVIIVNDGAVITSPTIGLIILALALVKLTFN